ncbi:MAG: hypothetical protein FWC94_01180 [Bacteroidales bacterium]|nr:hypothetical protein [Bacteroidales bacterium]
MKKTLLASKRKIVKFVKFTRELSIVVIGVGIALMAGDLLTNRSAKQDLRALLELVKVEIAHNIERSNMTLNFFTQEAEVANFIARNLNNPNIMDSVGYLTGWFDLFAYSTDAFDLLVASGRMHLIRDKDLLMQLTSLYRGFVLIQTHSIEYALAKNSMMGEVNQRPQDAVDLYKKFYLGQRNMIYMMKSASPRILQGFEQILERLENLRL